MAKKFREKRRPKKMDERTNKRAWILPQMKSEQFEMQKRQKFHCWIIITVQKENAEKTTSDCISKLF